MNELCLVEIEEFKKVRDSEQTKSFIFVGSSDRKLKNLSIF